MNATQKKRMLKLADYLEKVVAVKEKEVGKKKFDMRYWLRVNNDCSATKPGFTEASCGTSACAMGWAAVLFPKHLKLTDLKHRYDEDGERVRLAVIKFGKHSGYNAVAAFFGIERDDSEELFGPDVTVNAKQKAKELRAFVKRAA